MNKNKSDESKTVETKTKKAKESQKAQFRGKQQKRNE